MAVAAEAQTRLDERIVDSTELESLLEERATAKERAAMANSTAKGLDERAKTMVEEYLEGDEGVIRVGRFRITKSAIPARSVSFETSPATRVRISAVED